MKPKITYAQLKDRMAGAAGASRKEIHSLLKELTVAAGTGLTVTRKVNLAGLGRFSLKVQSARTGRNPRTGEAIDIPEKNRVHFLPEAQLRRHINRKYEQMSAAPAPRPEAPAEVIAAVSLQSADAPGSPDRLEHPEISESLPPAVKKATRGTDPEAPLRPVESEKSNPKINQTLPPTANSAAPVEISIAPSENETPGQRPKKLAASAAILILILAASAFFLWPRSGTGPAPVPPRPVPVAVNPHGSTNTPPLESARPAPAAVAATAPAEPAPTAVITGVHAVETTATGPALFPAYTVTPGDSLWKISNTIYKYAYFWPAIFGENHGQLEHPDTLTVGLRLNIPAFKGRVGRLTESDFHDWFSKQTGYSTPFLTHY